MAEDSKPWSGTTVGDAGPYSDENWWEIWETMAIAARGEDTQYKADTGVLMGSGLSPDMGLGLTADSPVSANVILGSGAALVNGTWYRNDNNPVTFAVAANSSGNARIDTLVLRRDNAAQTVRGQIKQGTPAASPVPPSLQQNQFAWEIPLWDIAVANGFTVINQSDLTDRRIWANASSGLYPLDILNNSGGVLETGDLVKWDTTANRAVTTTTTYGDPNIAGVWVGRTANGEYGRMLVRGVGIVKSTAGVTRGDPLVASTTAKKAVAVASTNAVSKMHPVGIALEGIASAGFVTAYIDIEYKRSPACFSTAYNKGSDITTTSATLVDIDGTNLKATLDISTGRIEVLMTGTFYTDAGAGHLLAFDVAIDGTPQGHIVEHLPAESAGLVTYHTKILNVTPGTRAITIQWKIDAGTGKLFSDATSKVLFSVTEF